MSGDRNGAAGKPTNSAQDLQLLVEAIPAAVWRAGPDGAIEYVNKQVLDYIGAPLDEILGWGWMEKVHRDDIVSKVKTWLKNLHAGKPHDASCRFRGADGQYRWFAVRAQPLRGDDGEIVKWYGVLIDIDGQRKAEEAVRESEAKFRDYAESASDWFWEIGPDYRFTMLTENTFCAVASERIGKLCWDRALDVETEPEKWRLVWAALEERKPFRDFVYRSMSRDGPPIYVKTSAKPIFDDRGEFRGYRGAGSDVTAAMRAREEHERLRQLESDLAHMNRLSVMGELAASLAHEITQPIGSARNNARAALNFLDRRPPDLGEVAEALGCVVGDADRAGAIVDRIRAHIKKTAPRMDRFDLNEAIAEVIGLARSETVRNQVLVQTRLMEEAPQAQGDRVQFQQVVLNLVLNAVEAMSAIDDRARELLISAERSGTSEVLIAVRDSGPGIDPERRERVFDAFYTTKLNGIGMGLSICRSIVLAHGGRLWVEANAPHGAAFQFTLPSTEAG